MSDHENDIWPGFDWNQLYGPMLLAFPVAFDYYVMDKIYPLAIVSNSTVEEYHGDIKKHIPEEPEKTTTFIETEIRRNPVISPKDTYHYGTPKP